MKQTLFVLAMITMCAGMHGMEGEQKTSKLSFVDANPHDPKPIVAIRDKITKHDQESGSEFYKTQRLANLNYLIGAIGKENFEFTLIQNEEEVVGIVTTELMPGNNIALHRTVVYPPTKENYVQIMGYLLAKHGRKNKVFTCANKENKPLNALLQSFGFKNAPDYKPNPLMILDPKTCNYYERDIKTEEKK